MNLSAPTKPLFLISVVLVILAIIGNVTGKIPFLDEHNFWAAIVGFVVLAFGCVMKGA